MNLPAHPAPPAGGTNATERLIARAAPGLPALMRYSFAQDFRHDLIAGVSVAAVALPVAIAYAQLAGFDPVIGLYSCILPLVAYAVFGTSRQLIVNPDAATCAMIAAAIAPLAVGDRELYFSLAIALTFFTGLFCIAGSLFRLGALADFLSRPILVGFMNGIAISIFLGQVGKLLGFPVETDGIIPRLFEIVSKLPDTHMATLAVGLASFLVLFAVRRFIPRLPAALVAIVIAAVIVRLTNLDATGVAILGPVPAGLPPLRFPIVPLEHVPALAGDAAGLALVLFTSGVLTARSFAVKGGYEIDIDRESAAFGTANVASALSHGFAVTGADSRTAMAVAAGGRTQVTGLVAAATIGVVLLFFTGPLQYVPNAALGAVLVFAALSLFDVQTLREIWRFDRLDLGLAVITMLGVVAVGAINGVLVAVGLALVRFVKQIARPRDEILGEVEGLAGFHSIARHQTAKTRPGIVLFRFNAPLTFFNAEHFRKRALAVADGAGAELRWFIIDAIPIGDVDVDGLHAIRDLKEALDQRGVTLVIAGRRTEIVSWLREIDIYRDDHHAERFFPTLRQAVKACRRDLDATAPQ